MGEALREAALGRGRGERFGEVRGPVPPQGLVANGEDVVDVPAKLSARVRLLSTGEERKSDRLDAVYTAVAAWQSARACARSVGEEDLVAVLRMLTERRDDLLVKARTRAMRTTSTRCSRTSWCPARQAPLGLGPTARPPEAGAPDRRARRAYRRGRRGNLASLTEVYGLGAILAAKIIGRVGDVRRFPSKGHYFASYTGTAPVEASRAARSCATGSRGQETGSALRRSTHRWTCSAMRTRSSRLSAPRHKFDA
jgi:transposase